MSVKHFQNEATQPVGFDPSWIIVNWVNLNHMWFVVVCWNILSVDICLKIFKTVLTSIPYEPHPLLVGLCFGSGVAFASKIWNKGKYYQSFWNIGRRLIYGTAGTTVLLLVILFFLFVFFVVFVVCLLFVFVFCLFVVCYLFVCCLFFVVFVFCLFVCLFIVRCLFFPEILWIMTIKYFAYGIFSLFS